MLERFENLDDLTEVKIENDVLIYDNTISDIKSCNNQKGDSMGDERYDTIKKETDPLHIQEKDPKKIENRNFNLDQRQESNQQTLKLETKLFDVLDDAFGMDYTDDDLDKDYIPNEKDIDIKDHEIEDDDKTVKEYVVSDPITTDKSDKVSLLIYKIFSHYLSRKLVDLTGGVGIGWVPNSFIFLFLNF